jgi:hypothetical protein
MQTATEQVRAAFAERISGFPLVTGAAHTPRPLADQIAWRAAATKTDSWLDKIDSQRNAARFTADPITTFGGLL